MNLRGAIRIRAEIRQDGNSRAISVEATVPPALTAILDPIPEHLPEATKVAVEQRRLRREVAGQLAATLADMLVAAWEQQETERKKPIPANV